ncbi:MAG TPA: phage tail assembly protein [Arthrobacter sp.]
MSALSLDDLRKGAEQKYPDFEIETEDGRILGFHPIFRLPKAKRRLVASAFDLKTRMEGIGEDSDVDQPELLISVLSDALKAAERTKGDHAELAKWAGTEDLGIWLFVFTNYSETTELGEASPSGS